MKFFIELFINGLLTGALYSLVGLSLVAIYKASGLFTFDKFTMILLVTFITNLLLILGLPLWLAILVILAIVIMLSFAVERMVLRPLLAQPVLSQIMATVGLMIIFLGIYNTWNSVMPEYVLRIDVPTTPLRLGVASVYLVDIIGGAVAVAILIALGCFYLKSRTGLVLRALSDDHEATYALGVPVGRLWVITWIIAGIVALVTGLLWAIRWNVSPALIELAFKGIPVVIMGGIDSFIGAIVGGIIIGVSENIAAGLIDPLVGGGTKEFFPYLLMLIMLWIKPYGFFGREIIERV